jgi:hypothetical protein
MNISNDPRIPKVEQGVIDHKTTNGREVKDGKVSVPKFWPKEIGIGKGMCIEGNGIKGGIFWPLPIVGAAHAILDISKLINKSLETFSKPQL